MRPVPFPKCAQATSQQYKPPIQSDRYAMEERCRRNSRVDGADGQQSRGRRSREVRFKDEQTTASQRSKRRRFEFVISTKKCKQRKTLGHARRYSNGQHRKPTLAGGRGSCFDKVTAGTGAPIQKEPRRQAMATHAC